MMRTYNPKLSRGVGGIVMDKIHWLGPLPLWLFTGWQLAYNSMMTNDLLGLGRVMWCRGPMSLLVRVRVMLCRGRMGGPMSLLGRVRVRFYRGPILGRICLRGLIVLRNCLVDIMIILHRISFGLGCMHCIWL